MKMEKNELSEVEIERRNGKKNRKKNCFAYFFNIKDTTIFFVKSTNRQFCEYFCLGVDVACKLLEGISVSIFRAWCACSFSL